MDMELQNLMFVLLYFGLAMVQFFLAMSSRPSFRNVHSVPLCIGSV